MLNALNVFNKSIADAKGLSAIYAYLSRHVAAPVQYDDLLRSQIVYSVSAFDKLMHDIIRIGMVQAFSGSRTSTSKYLSESISIEMHATLTAAVVPPKEILFEQEVVRKLRFLSFQDPVKIAEGLSYIWDDKSKWDRIAQAMMQDVDYVRTRMKLIATRRNAIVHESDIDPISHLKTPITEAEVADVSDFIRICGNAIVNLVV